ncbi:MAG: hypothetical protein ABSA58_13910 [Acetobacteraceae bacterium]|jgi:hypothetical protein
MQTPSIIGAAKDIKPRFSLAMPRVRKQQQWFIEKDLFRFGLTDPMLVHALARVSRIPLEALEMGQIDHQGVYATHIQRTSIVVFHTLEPRRGYRYDRFVTPSSRPRNHE